LFKQLNGIKNNFKFSTFVYLRKGYQLNIKLLRLQVIDWYTFETYGYKKNFCVQPGPQERNLKEKNVRCTNECIQILKTIYNREQKII